ncbi:MAG: S1C family serine protease [Patescibacteria group bacterium]
MTNKFSIDTRFWIVVLLALACGLTAGSLSGVWISAYLSTNSSSYSGELNLNDLKARGSDFIIRDPKNVIVSQDLKITETLAGLKPIFVRIFKELAPSANKDSQKADYYRLSEPLFVGFIMTTDGWAIALAPQELKVDFKLKNYVAISGDRQIYKIDKILPAQNFPGNPLIFHLAGAANLPIKKIVPRSELSLGQTLLAIDNFNNIWPTAISSLSKSPDVLSSDYPAARLGLAGAGDNNFKNSFVFDLAGNLAAVISDQRELIPAFSYNYLANFLPTNNSVQRPSLGVHYLDLSQIKTAAVNLDKGAWLYSTASEAAVVKGGAASAAGLKAGDVITWINNQKIDDVNDLADLLSAYRAGDKITITYERGGLEQAVEVTLKALQ